LSTEEILRAGIVAAQSGDLTGAAALFAQVVKIDPSSEQGWLGLGFCVSAPDQQEYCFRRVLALNPGNPNARERLAHLSKPASRPPPAPPGPPAPAETLRAGNLREPLAQAAAPAPIPAAQANPVRPQPRIAPPAQTPPKLVRPSQTPGQKKRSNARLIVAIAAVPILVACGLGIGYVFSYLGLHPAVAAAQLPLPSPSNKQPSATPAATDGPTVSPPTPIPSPVPTVAYTPAFEKASCPFSAPVADVNCGYLIVPEDRTGDPAHTIRLAVAIYHSQSQYPAEPVIFLQGGPGAEAVKLSAAAYSSLVAPFLPKRDFIVFDQRGTGLSEPVLNCDELTKLYSDDVHGLIPPSTRDLVYSNAFLSCNGLMRAQGINLRAYTTAESSPH